MVIKDKPLSSIKADIVHAFLSVRLRQSQPPFPMGQLPGRTQDLSFTLTLGTHLSLCASARTTTVSLGLQPAGNCTAPLGVGSCLWLGCVGLQVKLP